MKGKVYLIPNLISETSTEQVIPDEVRQRVMLFKHFVVENEKVARRYLKKLDRAIDIDSLRFYDMGKHGDNHQLSDAITAAQSGHDIGVISDAGCPGVADPGSMFVSLAHQAGLFVTPLVGPSSILLALMASGLDGQNFSFHGYVPKDKSARIRFIKKMAQKASLNQGCQIFMDTPFRNMHLLEDILANSPKGIRLCVAKDITGSQELIQTKTIENWNKLSRKLDLHKVPALFILGH